MIICLLRPCRSHVICNHKHKDRHMNHVKTLLAVLAAATLTAACSQQATDTVKETADKA